ETCLRLMLTGGDRLVTRVPTGLPFTLVNNYGPTECTVVTTYAWLSPGDDRVPPIGRGIANARVYLLDQKIEPVPVGVKGELYIGGEGLARGYLGRPELTAERFIPNPFRQTDRERLYRTGDVVRYRSDGVLEFIGRRDEQVKVRGYRIEPGEIEAVLNEHPLVKQSVVVVSEDERGDKRFLWDVVGEVGASAAELKRHIREWLPEYMIPEAILILEEMPLTTNGKIDRKRLPFVRGADRQPEQEQIGPRTPVEEMLVGLYEEVLKL